jgi:hypothetical protein
MKHHTKGGKKAAKVWRAKAKTHAAETVQAPPQSEGRCERCFGRGWVVHHGETRGCGKCGGIGVLNPQYE